MNTCSGKPEERIVKMFSWHISRVGVGPIFNINQLVNDSFVWAGAFIRPYFIRLVKVFFFHLGVPAIAVGERGGTKRKHEMLRDRPAIAQQR